MPGSITDIPKGKSVLEPFPGEDPREWEIVTHNAAAATTFRATRYTPIVVRRDSEGNTEYFVRSGLDHDGAAAMVAELSTLWGADVFYKHPISA